MKKINLKGISDVLSAKELKNILGGSSSGSPKVDACKGKEYASPCSWEYDGKTYTGKCCGSFMGSPVHCTDLNCYN